MCKFEKFEIDMMIAESSTATAQTELAAAIVLIPKKDGMLRTCADYFVNLAQKTSGKLTRYDRRKNNSTRFAKRLFSETSC